MSVIINGDTGITTPAETVTGNTILGDASTDTLNVGNGGLVKDASGNVGIGTVSPSQKLQVAGTTNQLSLTTGTNELIVRASSTEAALYTFQSIPMAFYTNNTERMRIDSSGNVGIGTASPSTKLTVNANTVLPATAPATGTNLWVTGADATGSVVAIDSFGSFPILTFRRSDGTSASPTAVAANVSIGGISGFGYGATGYSSTARASIGFNTAESWTDTSQGTYQIFRTTAIGTTTLTERMRIDSSGNLLLGSTSATGNVSNTTQMVGGIFSTVNASGISALNATATTLFTLPNVSAGCWLISATLPGQSAVASYSVVAIVTTQATVASIATIKTATLATLSMSGLNVQITQSSGGTQPNCAYSAIRLF